MNKKLLSLLLAAVLLLSITAGCSKAPAVLSSVGEEIIVDVQTGTANDDADDEDEDTVATADKTAQKTDKQTKTGGKDADKTQKKDGKVTTTTVKNVNSTTARTRERRTTTLAPTTTAKPTTTRTFRTTVKRTYPTNKQIVVSCIGDSITAGQYYAALTAGAPADMAGALSDRYDVRGYGVSGSTAMSDGIDNGAAKGYVTTEKYADSLRLNADIVVIMLGTNDAKDYNWEMSNNRNGAHFKESLINLVTTYQNLSSAPTVILATPPKIFRGDIEWVPEYIPDEINPIIREVAQLTGCRVADVYAATENASREPDFRDGIHPSSTNGRSLIAHTIAAVIKEETGVA